MQELLQDVVRLKPEKHRMSPQQKPGLLNLQGMRGMSKIGG
jgi:hypothetical protein